MNATHFHLAFNHAPVFGSFVGLAIFIFAMCRANKVLQRTAFAIFILSGFFAIGVYLTGEPAEHTIANLSGVSESLVERHEEAAVFAFASILALAAVSAFGSFWFRNAPRIPGWFSACVLCVGITTSGVMAWTANLGGQVRHPEIRAPMETAELED